jgi:hypothetical protein
MYTPLSRMSLTKSSPSFSKPMTGEEATKDTGKCARRKRGGRTIRQKIDHGGRLSGLTESIHNISDSKVHTVRQGLTTNNKLRKKGNDEKVREEEVRERPCQCSHSV